MNRHDAQELRREPRRVAQMFDRIAGRYDLMNRLMTAGLDRRWRRLAAAEASLQAGDEALDVCCGTGDLTLELAAGVPGVAVVGLDLSQGMLAQARRKAARSAGSSCCPEKGAAGGNGRRRGAPAGSHVTFVSGDAMQLPFAADRFAVVVAAFGVRNLHDLPVAFAGMLQVTRPGGRLVCLEITAPPPGVGRRFHAFWFDRCVPLLGRLVAGDGSAYAYLPASVRAFPDADGLARLLSEAGWRRIRYRRLGMGIVALHVAEKPTPAERAGVADRGERTSGASAKTGLPYGASTGARA